MYLFVQEVRFLWIISSNKSIEIGATCLSEMFKWSLCESSLTIVPVGNVSPLC